jgi:CubicO group peptidase (beta-lactamase class C family)
MMTPYSEPRTNTAYGYQMWRMTFDHKGKSLDVWAMGGNGGNYVFVSPELNLVSVITTTNYGQRDGHPKSQKLFEQIILASIDNN